MAVNEAIPVVSDSLNLKKTMTYLEEVESLAQDILTERKIHLKISEKQNKLREAYRAVEQSELKTVALKFSGVYMDLSRKTCLSLLKEELAKITEEVEEKRNEIKEMLQKMRDLEHQPSILGFSLKPLTGIEMKAICKKFDNKI